MHQTLARYLSLDGSPRGRQLACLLGGAIGDALGYRVEFDDWSAIRESHGDTGIRLAGARGSLVVSDDTQMTLFTLEGLARGVPSGRIVDEIRDAYADWLLTHGVAGAKTRTAHGNLIEHETLRHRRAPGTTCLDALTRGGVGTIEHPANDRKGCGAVMRMAPLGFLGIEWNRHDVFRLGAEAGAVTHGHPDGYLPAGAMALLVQSALQGESWADGFASLQAELETWPENSGTLNALSAAFHAARQGGASRAQLEQLGEGWVGEEALAIGLYAAMAETSFARCIELASNHGGDSDSTASIAGQLYGARHGMSAIPLEAAERVDVLEPLLAVFERWMEQPATVKPG